MATVMGARGDEMRARADDTHSRVGQLRAHSLDSPRNIDTETSIGTSVKQSPVSAHVNLYIRNVAPEATDKELEDAFGRFGDVISCSVVRDPYTKECRGFAFVKVASEEVADAAMNADDELMVCSRRLGVERARRNGPHEKTPGQYLGIDRTVRDRYAGHKRNYDGGPRESTNKDSRDSFEDRRPHGGGFIRDRWDYVAGDGSDPYDECERYNPRRRFSPGRRAPGSPTRPGRGNVIHRGHGLEDSRKPDRQHDFERRYDRDHDRARGRERSFAPSQAAAHRNGTAMAAEGQTVGHRDDFGRDRR
jgi:transformer-2 protein